METREPVRWGRRGNRHVYGEPCCSKNRHEHQRALVLTTARHRPHQDRPRAQSGHPGKEAEPSSSAPRLVPRGPHPVHQSPSRTTGGTSPRAPEAQTLSKPRRRHRARRAPGRPGEKEAERVPRSTRARYVGPGGSTSTHRKGKRQTNTPAPTSLCKDGRACSQSVKTQGRRSDETDNREATWEQTKVAGTGLRRPQHSTLGPAGPQQHGHPVGGQSQRPDSPPCGWQSHGLTTGAREQETASSETPHPRRGTPPARPSHVPKHRDRPDAPKGEDWAT